MIRKFSRTALLFSCAAIALPAAAQTSPDGETEGENIIVTDGPYSETKELVGGYYVIEAADYAEAIEIAKTSPHLRFGGRIEVREIHNLM